MEKGVSATISWSGIYGAQSMNLTDFNESLTVPLVTTSTFKFSNQDGAFF